jgi:hypothetical protein
MPFRWPVWGKPDSARRSREAAPAGDEALASLGYIASLRDYLDALGHSFSTTFLMAISGDAFRFFYDRARPERAVSVFLNNPLRAACSALGFEHDIAFFETKERALCALAGHADQGRHAIIQLDGEFPLVRGGPPPSDAERSRNLTPADVAKTWAPCEGFLELGLYGYYIFTIGERTRIPAAREICLGAFRRAVKIATAYRRVRGCAIGLQAYEELAATLRARRDFARTTTGEVYRTAEWGGQPALLLRDSRQAAARFLEGVVGEFAGEEAEAVRKAIGLYRRTVGALDRVRERHPAIGGEPSGGFRLPSAPRPLSRADYGRFVRACRRAGVHVERAHALEGKAVDELQRVVNISEKTRM